MKKQQLGRARSSMRDGRKNSTTCRAVVSKTRHMQDSGHRKNDCGKQGRLKRARLTIYQADARAKAEVNRL